MKKIFVFILAYFLFICYVYGQTKPFQSKAYVDDIQLIPYFDTLIVTFKIKDRSIPHEWFYIDPSSIKFISQEGEIIKPSFNALSGSVEKWFRPTNKNQLIKYALTTDKINLQGNYKVEFNALPTYRPANANVAIYSLLLPGWGRYKLDTRKKYPLIYSLIAGLLWSSAITTQIIGYSNYQEYKKATNSDDAYFYYDQTLIYTRASYALYGTAIAFNLYDFISVIRKGTKNKIQNELEGYK